MKVKCGFSMGYAGTDEEWTEDVPDDVVEEGQEAVDAYLNGVRDSLFSQACEKISVWAEIEE